ncbi:unnamed protein product [Kuraishia capsulata CBS 1993]|uniref:IMS import disulfide relay-system CHCH-CHCH-like Cx9C domain-containing protein n=1 Tax=Kuraishia capsulata CBS 1993 TaxID=1382522 RepID=W6MQ84_9ASCO|nr:uncharacterized protein KUCA_T00004831001 [Kuraishia capsulata CBS 1993]CDK28846.1 unnamed protein product [Kuraishia capsulata CBS 1993]
MIISKDDSESLSHSQYTSSAQTQEENHVIAYWRGSEPRYVDDQRETFLDYYKCMNVTPDSDISHCRAKQESLQTCIQAKVPLYAKVSKTCEEQTNLFKSCITKNGGVKSKCIDEMNAVRECSLKVMAEDEASQKKGFPN